MQPVDYDVVASDYDRRYTRHQYAGIAAVLRRFLAGASGGVLEVGCGTGHWLGEPDGASGTVTGVDPSAAMLRRARTAAPRAHLIRAAAEALPLSAARFDRAFCINALHHFRDQAGALRECRRVLKPGGTFLTIGLDPHTGGDRWWIYDYFPASLTADRLRYSSTGRVRALLAAAGFVEAVTEEAQHIPAAVPFADAVRLGMLDRASTSQLMVIDEAEYAAGLERLQREQPTLRADLRVFATVAHVP